MEGVGKWALVPLVAGAVGFFFFSYQRHYPFHLALIMGVAALLFTWAAIRTWDQLHKILRGEGRKDRE